VQILDPRLAHRHWDWLVIPEHDRITGANIIPVQGSLNPVDDAWLAAARAQFAWLDQFPGPRLTVLVGGDSRHGRLPANIARKIPELMTHWHQTTGGSLLLTTSRRTPPALAAELARQLPPLPGLCWTGPTDGPNPYPGLLAFADQILCTADSVNLLSEACATRVPVCIMGAETTKGGPGRFARSLLNCGRACTSLFVPLSAISPLRETAPAPKRNFGALRTQMDALLHHHFKPPSIRTCHRSLLIPDRTCRSPSPLLHCKMQIHPTHGLMCHVLI